jgi:uncharacterized protein (TIGR03000 family)
VFVPADAELTIEGVRTKAGGEVRRFVSPSLPPLAAGKKYLYTLKASFTADGKPKTIEKTVHVEPGKEFEVDLRVEEVGVDTTPKVDTPPVIRKDNPPVKVDTPPVIKKDNPPVKKDTPPVEVPKKPIDLPEKKDDKKEETIRVPFVPTPQEVVDKMLEMASVKEGDVVYDLGCGDGRIVVTAVKKFKAKKGYGVDLDPERVKDSEANAKKAGVETQVEFKQGDVLKIKDLSEADVVTLYLLPEVNLRLKPILQKTLKPGARVVSHDFDMGDDWKPAKSARLDVDGEEHTVYLWVIGKGKE